MGEVVTVIVTAIESAKIYARTTNIRNDCNPVQRLNECLCLDRLIILHSL